MYKMGGMLYLRFTIFFIPNFFLFFLAIYSKWKEFAVINLNSCMFHEEEKEKIDHSESGVPEQYFNISTFLSYTLMKARTRTPPPPQTALTMTLLLFNSLIPLFVCVLRSGGSKHSSAPRA